MNISSTIEQLLKNEYKIEYNEDAIDKLREAASRIAADLLETTETIRVHHNRNLKKEDVRWVMDELRTNDEEAAIMRQLENHQVRDQFFDDNDLNKTIVPNKNLKRNAQLATKYKPGSEKEELRKNQLLSQPLLRTNRQESNQNANSMIAEEKTKFQMIFADESKKSQIPFFK